MAGPRRRSREIALQILHVMDVSPELGAEIALRRYFEHLAPAGGGVEDPDDFEAANVVADAEAQARADIAAAPSSPVRIDRPLVEDLVRGVDAHRAAIDQTLAGLSRNWRVERMAVVERNIIRIALYELAHCPDVPINVALNEAIELAKRFGTTEGAAFVNGLLDRAVTELEIRR
jgi:transcription antitermination protein NusB